MASLKNVHIYPYHSENKIIIRVLTLGETIDFDEAKELADRIYAFLDEAKYLKEGKKTMADVTMGQVNYDEWTRNCGKASLSYRCLTDRERLSWEAAASKVLEQKSSSPAHDPVLLFAQRVKAVTELFQCDYEQAVSIVEAGYSMMKWEGEVDGLSI